MGTGERQLSDAFGDRQFDGIVQPCPFQQPAKKDHWLQIELVGDDDRPIPWEAYIVELPSGQRIRGYLDENGIGRLEQLQEAGSCRVCFPRLDQDAWEALASSSPGTDGSEPA
jgi:hypothetical protein